MAHERAVTGREIREALESAGVVPSKQLGQNFLVDPNMARWIVSQLDAKEDETVVEVGPGTGALSEHLAGRVKRLVLIEFDPRLVAWLRQRFEGVAGVEVHHADGARFDVRSLFRHRPVKFLGNLPYSAGGAIMRNFLSRPHPFSRAVLMLQKEVIDRLAATPGSKDYGVLTLRTQVGWRVSPQRTVPPEAFHPRPRIDSAVAVLEPREDLAPFDGRLFDELVRRGFAQRRKQLKKQLPAEVDWQRIHVELGLPLTARGEELSLAQWLELSRLADPHPLRDLPQRGDERFDVVDAEDRVIGRASRAEVHARGLLHRAVHVFLFNRHGDLLLQKRSTRKDMHPGRWDSSVSGHLDAGEDYLPAARREMAEEMGVADAEPREIARLAASEETGWEHVRLFSARTEGPPRFPCSEVESAQWFPPAEIEAWTRARPADFAPGFLQCWREWMEMTAAGGAAEG